MIELTKVGLHSVYVARTVNKLQDLQEKNNNGKNDIIHVVSEKIKIKLEIRVLKYLLR